MGKALMVLVIKGIGAGVPGGSVVLPGFLPTYSHCFNKPRRINLLV